MPLFIDERWEYWTPDPEVAEILAASGACAGFAGLVDGRLEKVNSLGLRFGKGNPDHCRFRLAPERIRVGRPEVLPRDCKVCGETFRPDRASRTCCSRQCQQVALGRIAGAARTLDDALCPTCGREFRPLYRGQTFCSKSCFAQATRHVRPESGCGWCGAVVPPSASRNPTPRLYCSRGCKSRAANAALRARKRLAADAKPQGMVQSTHGRA